MHEALHFETARFEFREPKPHFINPCCFGEDVIAWLRPHLADLTAQGFEVDDEAIQEDYGWGLWVRRGKDAFWIAAGCATGDAEDTTAEWVVSVNWDPGLNLIRRLFHKPDPAAFAAIRDRVWAAIRAAPDARVLEA